MKFAAIDIGSNAVRLLLAQIVVDGNHVSCRKESFIRLPLRLGDDAFTQGRISEAKAEKLIQALIGFRHLITVYEPVDFMACATSAMREAANAPAILDALHARSGIACQVIDGTQEAEIIFANHCATRVPDNTSSLYIDVGGGSTELTLFVQGSRVTSQSFNIGTIRVLQGLVRDETWTSMRQWIKEQCVDFHPITAIGSGGNINKLTKMVYTTKTKNPRTLSFKKLQSMHQDLRAYTLEERVNTLALRRDRADVIIPACEIYLSVMQWAKISKMVVPQIGLVDGIVHMLYQQYIQDQSD